VKRIDTYTTTTLADGRIEITCEHIAPAVIVAENADDARQYAERYDLCGHPSHMLTNTPDPTAHVFLVAFEVESDEPQTRDDAQLALIAGLVAARSKLHDHANTSWWIAEPDRLDGSDNDTASFDRAHDARYNHDRAGDSRLAVRPIERDNSRAIDWQIESPAILPSEWVTVPEEEIGEWMREAFQNGTTLTILTLDDSKGR
jgi:hypothetical protein